jgi:hypothetical protein
MDFLFHVPFFCTAAAAMADILTVSLVNIEFRKGKSSHFVQILLVVYQNCLNQFDVNNVSSIRAHCLSVLIPS